MQAICLRATAGCKTVGDFNLVDPIEIRKDKSFFVNNKLMDLEVQRKKGFDH